MDAIQLVDVNSWDSSVSKADWPGRFGCFLSGAGNTGAGILQGSGTINFNLDEERAKRVKITKIQYQMNFKDTVSGAYLSRDQYYSRAVLNTSSRPYIQNLNLVTPLDRALVLENIDNEYSMLEFDIAENSGFSLVFDTFYAANANGITYEMRVYMEGYYVPMLDTKIR